MLYAPSFYIEILLFRIGIDRISIGEMRKKLHEWIFECIIRILCVFVSKIREKFVWKKKWLRDVKKKRNFRLFCCCLLKIGNEQYFSTGTVLLIDSDSPLSRETRIPIGDSPEKIKFSPKRQIFLDFFFVKEVGFNVCSSSYR